MNTVSYTHLDVYKRQVKGNSMVYLKPAKTFIVLRTTLFRFINEGGNDLEALVTQVGGKPILTNEIESELVQYALHIKTKSYNSKRSQTPFISHIY